VYCYRSRSLGGSQVRACCTVSSMLTHAMQRMDAPDEMI
jgi:hypothetical protein